MSSSLESVPSVGRQQSARRAQLVVALIIGMLASLLGGVASPASAVGSSLSGTVTGGSGTGTVPLAGVRVALTQFTAGGVLVSADTDAGGNYVFAGIPAGDYLLAFSAPTGSFYVTEYWNDASFGGTGDVFSCLDILTVADGVALTGYNATLAIGGSIAGTVSPSGSRVTAFNTAGQPVQSDFSFDGDYVLEGLPVGSYKLKIDSTDREHVGEWWNDKASIELADAITVTAGVAVTGRDVVLADGGRITGNVKNVATANVAGVKVSAINAALTSVSSTTDAAGNFSIAGLPTGSYTLYFDGSPVNLVSEWWNNQLAGGSANFFDVTAGATVSGRNAVLAAGARISGRVTGGSPAVNVFGATVAAIGTPPNRTTAITQTGADGSYLIQGLPAGSYTLYFASRETDNYLPEYWDGQSSRTSATFFTVEATATVIGRDASLVNGSTISGVLQNSRGEPLLSGGVAVVYSATGTEASYANLVKRVKVGSDGRYTITGLPIGSYRVGFTDSVFPPGDGSGDIRTDDEEAGGLSADGGLAPSDPHVSKWWINQYSFSAAATVVISRLGQVVPRINANLANPRFADVRDPSSSFYAPIEWMAIKGYATGTTQACGDPLYKPTDPVSRQAMALFLYRLSGETFAPPVAPTFGDVATDSQFYTAIEWMASRGISAGTPAPPGAPLFKPADPVSRQTMAFFLARYARADLTTLPTTQRFADVPLTATSAAAIEWMFVNGISTGTPVPGGLPLYKPSDPVSRQAMAAFLFRFPG